MGLKVLLISIVSVFVTLFAINPLVFAQTKVDISFVNHPQAGFPEQDVFISTNGQVKRVGPNEATSSAVLSQMLYVSANVVEHDPFQLTPNPLGPFPKGHPLGFTLAEWLAGSGSGTYTVSGESAELNLTMQSLVKNGVYTVWCSRLTLPPNVKIVDRPCGKEDGSENVFKAGPTGNGVFNLKLEPLEKSTKEEATVIALAYHSDGKTYGADPGDFGSKTHVQLFFPLPVEEAEAAGQSPQAEVAQQGLSAQNWVIIIIVIVVVVVILWWIMRRPKETNNPPI